MVYLKLQNEKGVTLIELLLALSLLTIVLITFMAFFTNAFKYNSMSSDKVKGVNFTREQKVEFNDRAIDTEGVAFKAFMKKVSDGTVSFSKIDNPGLNLFEDIIEKREEEKPELNDGSSGDIYYLLKLDNPPYKVFVYVKSAPDYTDLYRLYIETYDKKNNLLSKTYTYFEIQ